jgi:hypothetical protein
MYRLPNIIRLIKSNRIGHIARMGEKNACRGLVEISQGQEVLRRIIRLYLFHYIGPTEYLVRYRLSL